MLPSDYQYLGALNGNPTPADFAYRGYLVRWNLFTRHWWIEKGGAFIAHAPDRTAAMRTIDELQSCG